MDTQYNDHVTGIGLRNLYQTAKNLITVGIIQTVIQEL